MQSKFSLINKIINLSKYKDLIILSTSIDFKLKYKNSLIGFFWSLCEPLAIFFILYIVFNNILRFDIKYYSMFILYGIFFWNFFSRSTISALNSIISKSHIIKKIYFPREILVISNIATSFLLTIVELHIFIIMIVILKISLSIWIFEGLFILILFFIFNLGISFFLATFNVIYRDIQFIWNIILQAGFFLTPIFYSVNILGEKMQIFSYLNPLTIYLNTSRDAILYSMPVSGTILLIMGFFSFFILFLGYITFIYYEPFFAEEI